MGKRPENEAANNLLNQRFRVLEHGFVALVDYMGTDESVDQTARTSHGSEARDAKDVRRLLRRLVHDQHTSPLEFVEVVLHVRLPIFVARQWIRHRTASTNEMSGRYQLLSDEVFRPEVWRLQHGENKQMSDQSALEAAQEEADAWEQFNGATDASLAAYQWLTSHGVARELARTVLPVGTFTEWRWKTDLHNLMNFLRLRLAPDAQPEIQVYARIIAAMVRQCWPVLWEAFEDYTLNARKFSAEEMRLLSRLVGARVDLATGERVLTAASVELVAPTISRPHFSGPDSEWKAFMSKFNAPEPHDYVLPAPI